MFHSSLDAVNTDVHTGEAKTPRSHADQRCKKSIGANSKRMKASLKNSISKAKEKSAFESTRLWNSEYGDY